MTDSTHLQARAGPKSRLPLAEGTVTPHVGGWFLDPGLYGDSPRKRAAKRDFRPTIGDLLDRFGNEVVREQDQTIFFESDRTKHGFKVVSGLVRLLLVLDDGRRQIVDFVYPGQFFGFSRGLAYGVTAEAVTDTVVMRYPRRRVDDLVATWPVVGMFVLQIVAEELRSAQKQLVLLGRQSAMERVAVFLLDAANRSADVHEAQPRAHLIMTRRDIADYLGLTIETVCRTISQMKQAGLILLHSSDDIELLKPKSISDLTC